MVFERNRQNGIFAVKSAEGDHTSDSERAAQERLARSGQRLALAQRALDAVSPLATVKRGFAIVKRADGTVLTDAATVAVGEEIEASLARGILKARVTERR